MRSTTQQFHENDFSKTILEWSFDIYTRPLALAMRQPALPSSERNIQRYYSNFLPFILEESRAIIASGLDKARQYNELRSRNNRRNNSVSHLSDAKPFPLKLQKKAKYPRNEGNPLSMTFRGAIPEKIEHGKSMIVLLLKTKNIEPEKEFIALATENQNATELYAKIILSSDDYYAYGECFKSDEQWEAHYLGSVISEQRMYEACLDAIDIPCVKQIARAEISQPRVTRRLDLSTDLSALNQSQREAVHGFLNARDNSALLLEGPPGTGKTTTLVNLLTETAARNKRTLVSAHSNKGVQVLASRALEKMPDTPMILVGVESKLPDHLKPIFLNRWDDGISHYLASYLDQVDQLAENPSVSIGISTNELIDQLSSNVQLAQSELNKFHLIDSDQLRHSDRQCLYNISNKSLSQGDFKRLNQAIANLATSKTKKKWKALQNNLNIMQEKWWSYGKEDVEMHLLDHAQVVFATLITCGRKSLKEMDPVDYLLIDEASQSVEPATLIPMRFKPDKVLLVGDTKQLPATVISKALDDSEERADSKHYKWSMMWRLIEENQQPNLMLTIQYRMHPWICQWPSGQFYGDRLITSPDILPVNTISNTGLTSRPYAVYQVAGQAESRDGSHSISNMSEANYVLSIIEHIRRHSTQCSIGVITPYSAQKQLINNKLNQRRQLLPLVDVNTVDGFQGDERDVIIISFVRTHVSEFLKEYRRLNVAITRPKACLIILGAPSLRSNDIGALMADAQRRNVLYSEEALKLILRTGNVITATLSNNQHADIQTLAWQADAKSQFDYGQRFESADRRLAYLWYRRAAENHYPLAQLMMAKLYFAGNTYISQDTQLAISWVKKAVAHPLPEAHYFLGRLFILGDSIVQNLDAGIDWCKRAADVNFVEAIAFLASCYEEGKGVTKSTLKAINYYRKAAKLNDPQAMVKLALLLASGTDDNKREAIKWYKKLAQTNNIAAYYSLAELSNNFLNKQDEALVWYLKAADNENVLAQYEVAIRFKNGYHGCEINLSRSAHYLQLASENNHLQAKYLFAMCLLQGEGIAKDNTKALSLFKAAAVQRHTESQYQAGLLLLESSPYQAYRYFMQAAEHEHEHAPAQYECIKYQIKFGRDLNECLIFCKKLHQQGNAELTYIAARLLETGIAGMTNKQQANQYYTQLVSSNHTGARLYQGIFLEEGAIVDKNLEAARTHYEECLDKQPKAKRYLARLLLQSSSDEQTQRRGIALLQDYINNPAETLGLTELELSLENLIAPRTADNIDLFIASINTTSSYANYQLGLMFQEGRGVQQNISRAMHFFKKAADIGDAESQYQYALLKCVDSPSDAYDYFSKAGLQEHALAQLEAISFQIKANHDLPQCLSFCERLAANGNQQVQFLLARILDTGIAGMTDKRRANTLYAALVEQDNDVNAQYYYARILEECNPTPQDLRKSADLYQSCFEAFPDAKLRCAVLLLRKPITQTPQQQTMSVNFNAATLSEIDIDTIPCLPHRRGQHSQQFFQTSAHDRAQHPSLSEEQKRAVKMLDDYYKNNSDSNSAIGTTLEAELEKLIKKLCPDLSVYSPVFIETDIAQANYLLGKIYQEGKGVKADPNRAIDYYQKARSQYPDANYRIGYMYEAGVGVRKSWSRAKAYYQEAADKGHELATKRLNWSYSVFGNKTLNDAELEDQKSCAIM